MSTPLICPYCTTGMAAPIVQPGVHVRCPSCKQVFLPAGPRVAPAPRRPARPDPEAAEVLSLDDAEPLPPAPPPPPDRDEPKKSSGALVASLVIALLVVSGVGLWLAKRVEKQPDPVAEVEPETKAEPKTEPPKKDDPPKTTALPADESNDKAAIDTLIQVLRTGDPDDRLAAARRLGALGAGGTAAIPALLAAADSKTPALEAAAGAALAKIGPPKTLDGEFAKAVASKSAVVREYALATLAAAATVPAEAVGPLVAALTDPTAKTRESAVKALGTAGPAAKMDAFAPLLDLLADPDEAVRTAATAAVAKLGPPTIDDRPTLAARLTHTDARVRLAAATLLAPLITSPEEVATTWTKVTKDGDAGVRAVAVAQFVKYPEALEKNGDVVILLINDASIVARATGVTAAPKVRGTLGLEVAVEKLLDSESDVELKKAAFVTAVTLADADYRRVPLFRKALISGPDAAKRLAADKLAATKADAAPAVDDLIACVGSANAEVSAAAIRALTAVGREAEKARPAVARSFAAEKTAEPVLMAAVDYLVRTEAGLKALWDARDRTLPAEVVVALCRAFARAPDADSLRWMTTQAGAAAGCREVVADALAKHGDDSDIRNLIEMTYATRVGKTGKDERVPVDSRRWALETITKMRYTDVSAPATRVKLIDRVRDLSKSVRPEEKELAAEATTFLRRLKP